jgi:hypothetical protein
MTDTHHPDHDGWDRIGPWCIGIGLALLAITWHAGTWLP